MGFYDIYSRHKGLDAEKLSPPISAQRLESFLGRDTLDAGQFLSMLSPSAEDCLEIMARKAQEITSRNFGKTIQLYTPLYLSNYCDNQCLYCGFNLNNPVERKKLNPQEVEKEARFIYDTGLRHILVLTGESRKESPLDYIIECVLILKKYFSSVSVEVYPLEENEYARIVSEGVDGLTVYQETYDQGVYARMHPGGPKRNYMFRLGSPERGARGGMRSVNIGALLGLGDWRKEIFFTGLHAKYLQDEFPDVEIAVSLPRLRPHTGNFKPDYRVSDLNIVQSILALRIFLPRAGITVSTRENPEFRENLVPLGITKMSAGSTTRVGGHTIETYKGQVSLQFEISDKRSVDETIAMIKAKGYQPVLKDWLHF